MSTEEAVVMVLKGIENLTEAILSAMTNDALRFADSVEEFRIIQRNAEQRLRESR